MSCRGHPGCLEPRWSSHGLCISHALLCCCLHFGRMLCSQDLVQNCMEDYNITAVQSVCTSSPSRLNYSIFWALTECLAAHAWRTGLSPSPQVAVLWTSTNPRRKALVCRCIHSSWPSPWYQRCPYVLKNERDEQCQFHPGCPELSCSHFASN